VVDAARTLFLRKGYAGTTMEEIASLAGLTKRTVYNNYRDKDALFTQIVADVIAYAEAFAGGLHEELMAWVTAANLRATLVDLGRRMALAIVRPEVVALRRLLIGEARSFPALAKEYFDRAPGQVIEVPWRRGLSTWAGRIAASARRAARGRAVRVSRGGRAARPRDARGDDADKEASHRRRAGGRGDVPGEVCGRAEDLSGATAIR